MLTETKRGIFRNFNHTFYTLNGPMVAASLLDLFSKVKSCGKVRRIESNYKMCCFLNKCATAITKSDCSILRFFVDNG